MNCTFLVAILAVLAVCSAQRKRCEDGEHLFGTRRGFICIPCGRGTAGVGGVCPACPQGQFQAETGQLECDICPVGTYNDRIRRSECTPCPDGLMTGRAGAQSVE